MFGRKESFEEERERHLQSRLKRYKFSQSQGAALTRRLYEIRQLDPANRPEAVQKLFEDARRHLALIRQMITSRTRYNFSSAGEDPVEGDIAACIAEHVTGFMREHTTAPQARLEVARVMERIFFIDPIERTEVVAPSAHAGASNSTQKVGGTAQRHCPSLPPLKYFGVIVTAIAV